MTYDESRKYQQGDPPVPDAMDADVVISHDTRREHRIPPGQARTRKWPVLHYGRVPSVPLERWRLEVEGLVENSRAWTWEEFRSLPRVKVFSDFHCVTRWSRLGNLWEGVSTREILSHCGPHAEARFVVAKGYDDGWTTNIPLEHFLADDALFADTHDGQPLSPDHGGPVRLLVPRLYAWKSAKWVRAIKLVSHDQPGYWEQLGYHDRGDPWQEERFR
jgi:DMSO/TMAO reductase YedYZ molybdopterin-dependent catalytic subunit